LHPDAVEFVARELKADPASVAAYDWSGRTMERHHGQIRLLFGFRVCGEAEGEKLAKSARRLAASSGSCTLCG
jgi:hypothetical protein